MLLRYKRKLLYFIGRISPRLPLIGGFLVILIFLKLIVGGIDWLQQKGISVEFLKSMVTNNPRIIIDSYKGRTNIVLLGIAGGNHAGSDLTDTMIFVSIDLESADTLLVSLPRDIWSPTLQDKINSAYHYGEKKKKGGGLILAKSIIEEILGQPIHYAVLIDFNGFKDAVDTIGGIEVDVPESFTDKKFPIPGRENDECNGDIEYSCRYETIKFKKGKQTMDGTTALKYVRSRNAQGRQGTDYARSERQQQVILAFKNKATSLGILTNPLKIKELYGQLNKTIKTDAQLSEMLSLARLSTKFSKNSLRKLVLDAGDEEQGRAGWLYSPPVSRYGRWVLMPRNNSYNLLHNLASCYIASSSCIMQPEDY